MRPALFALCCAVAPCLGAQQVEAELACRFTGTDFVYDCTIRLRQAGAALTGAQVTVGADMPAMPGAHAIAPLPAGPGRNSGEYHVTLDLEMTGVWAVTLRLDGAVRDTLTLHYDFDEQGARPARRR